MDKLSQKSKPAQDADAVSVTSKVSKTSTQLAREDEERLRLEHEEKLKEIRSKYQSIIDKDEKKY